VSWLLRQASFLQPYYAYMTDGKNGASLLPRFMGMYALEQAGASAGPVRLPAAMVLYRPCTGRVTAA
jgi:hypothetical protein